MSQRDVTQHFPALADEASDLEETFLEFFEEHIQHKFPDPDCEQSALVLCFDDIQLCCIQHASRMQVVHVG